MVNVQKALTVFLYKEAMLDYGVAFTSLSLYNFFVCGPTATIYSLNESL